MFILILINMAYVKTKNLVSPNIVQKTHIDKEDKDQKVVAGKAGCSHSAVGKGAQATRLTWKHQ